MQLISMKRYTNGARVKHIKNRNVGVFTDPKNDDGVIIEFKMADAPKESIDKPSALHAIIKGKVKLTGLRITHEAAVGLYECLKDYYSRVYNLNKQPESSSSADGGE